MPRARPQIIETACHVRRLMEFAEPRPDDTCLAVTSRASELVPIIRPWVRQVTTGDGVAFPEGPFTLVALCLVPAPEGEPVDLIRRALNVCAERLIIADLVRTRAGDTGRIERLRDPGHTAMPTLTELVDLVGAAGGRTRRLDLFTIERPIEPWLAEAEEADEIRRELADELDGGPKTGARPRLVGRELWFAQSWAYLAAEPVSSVGRRRRTAARPRR